jgi:type IV pilus assembly protein PilN
MIKINLLPKKDVKKAKVPTDIGITKDIFLKLGLPVGIAILIVFGVFAYVENTTSDLKKEIENNKKILAQLQQKIEEVKNFEKMNKEFELKTKIIEDLKKMQSSPVILLNTISKNLPDGVWLTAVTYDNTVVNIEGLAFSNLNIVAFVDNLKSVREFQDLTLVESQQTEVDKAPVYKFLIRFNFSG